MQGTGTAKKIGLVSLGCAKNLVDGETMLGEIARCGYELTGNPEEADVLIVNTCTFIEAAQQESIETILEMAGYKKGGRCRGLIVTGCMAQMFREKIQTELPEVDAVLGTGSYGEIVRAIGHVLENRPYQSFGDIDLGVMHGEERVVTTPRAWAYLKIAEGCDNRCSYCVIPSVRGRFRSRSMEEIVREAGTLAEAGVRELIVVAQDTTRYGEDLYGKYSLAPLLKRLCAVPKIRWIRLHYCYPDKITDELIETVAGEIKILKYLDVPVQHICDPILRRMNRKGDGRFLRLLLKKLRDRIPGLVLRTSLIVGFPGETESDFEELSRFVSETGFDRLGAFVFSPQEGTPACLMSGQVDEEEKRRRQEILMLQQSRTAYEKGQSRIGEAIEVLCEGKTEEGAFWGRSYMDSPEIDGRVVFEGRREVLPGEFVQILIKSADGYDLTGVLSEGKE